jgi:predicted Rossmann fold nucleotide-binding protein DprA/Smf involved in DNA uptake
MEFSTKDFMPDASEGICCVEYVSVSGNSFARSKDGHTVFINRRITERLSLTEGDLIKAKYVLNFEDKQENCRYRAIFAESKGSIFDANQDAAAFRHDEPEPAPSEPPLRERILQALLVGPLSTGTIARSLKVEAYQVSNVCGTLHAEGKISRADVYRSGTQSKASRRIWALSDTEYEIDPTIDAVGIDA